VKKNKKGKATEDRRGGGDGEDAKEVILSIHSSLGMDMVRRTVLLFFFFSLRQKHACEWDWGWTIEYYRYNIIGTGKQKRY